MKTKAFTLIELLVVIAIIALLLSIIVPSLRLVKRKAASVVCSVNVKNLSLAWFTYQESNDSRMISPEVAEDLNRPYGWVFTPVTSTGTVIDDAIANGPLDPVTDDDEIRGIEKGQLFEYMKAADAYHCPADTRKSKFDLSKIFRSYSMPSALKHFSKFSDITSPSMRYNFVEEADGRNFNMGMWELDVPWDGGGILQWQDPMAVNHGDSSVLGFCDGHAETHKWQDQYTKQRVIDFFESDEVYYNSFLSAASDMADLEYMARGWAARKRQY